MSSVVYHFDANVVITFIPTIYYTCCKWLIVLCSRLVSWVNNILFSVILLSGGIRRK